jgi:integrase
MVAKGNPGVHAFSPMTLHCVFNRILAKAGISPVDELGEKLTAHSFRHTFGTMLAEQGANAFVIQNALRHADPKMTSRYVERATMATEINVSEFLGQEGKNAK